MRLLGVGIWRRAFAFSKRTLGKLTERTCFLGWGIGCQIWIPIIGAFVCVGFLDGRGANVHFGH